MADPGEPPFEPDSLRADLDLVDWRPGARVELRRRLSAKPFVALPGSFLLLAGPADLLWQLLRGRELDVATVVSVTVLGFLFGGGCALLFVRTLPRSLVFDWERQVLVHTTVLGGGELAFDQIRCLKLITSSEDRHFREEVDYVEYYAEISIVTASEGELRLLETRASRDEGEPIGMTEPLVRELAAAIGTSYRVDDRTRAS